MATSRKAKKMSNKEKMTPQAATAPKSAPTTGSLRNRITEVLNRVESTSDNSPEHQQARKEFEDILFES